MKTDDIVISLHVQTDLILRIKKVERERERERHTHTHRQTHRLTDREYSLLSEISLKQVSTL